MRRRRAEGGGGTEQRKKGRGEREAVLSGLARGSHPCRRITCQPRNDVAPGLILFSGSLLAGPLRQTAEIIDSPRETLRSPQNDRNTCWPRFPRSACRLSLLARERNGRVELSVVETPRGHAVPSAETRQEHGPPGVPVGTVKRDLPGQIDSRRRFGSLIHSRGRDSLFHFLRAALEFLLGPNLFPRLFTWAFKEYKMSN